MKKCIFSLLLAGIVLFAFGQSIDDKEISENAFDDSVKITREEQFIYPVQTPITISAFFGWQKDPFTEDSRFHTAIDLAGTIGMPVMAAMSGTISKTDYHRIYGNYIILNHGNGYETIYTHLSVLSVNQGDKVRQGDKIGEMGNSGLSTGPHLHFGIFKNQIPVNPLDFLCR